MKPCLFGIAAALMSWFPVQAQTPTPDRAIALEQQGDLSGAEREWELWLRDHPKDAEAFASLGVLLSKEGKYKGAVAAYRKALAVNAKLRGTQLNLGLAEFKQGEFQAAIAPFRAAIAAEPDNMQARTLLGLSYYGAKRFTEAVKSLQVAAKSDPGNTELRRVLAQSCFGRRTIPAPWKNFATSSNGTRIPRRRISLPERRWMAWGGLRKPSPNFRRQQRLLRVSRK